MSQELELINKLLEIYDQKHLAAYLNQQHELNPSDYQYWTREAINKWVNGKSKTTTLNHTEFETLKNNLLPSAPKKNKKEDFTFIDLFAGIGGIRKGFENSGGKCLFTSEWNKYAIKTYKANYYCDPDTHTFNEDIRDITLTDDKSISDQQAYEHINNNIPDHDVLLAGFPCQPFSIAGVSKKNSLGKKHGFECTTQGTLFFDVARIIRAKRPATFLLENVKNLKSHDKGKTFKVITDTLDELGYFVADVNITGSGDPKVIDAQNFLPQHRERILLVGFRKDLGVHHGFTLKDIKKKFPKKVPSLGDILEPADTVDKKYILTPNLWSYLFNYALKHKAKGNGFGYGLVNGNSIARTLSARYYKDGSEILINRGWDESKNINNEKDMKYRPRRLTPRECSRLMGFDKIGEKTFRIPVSDTQAYKQFGNSVVVPVFSAVAKLMKPGIIAAREIIENADNVA